MENPSTNLNAHGHVLRLALVWLALPLVAFADATSTAIREHQRRSVEVEEAQELLRKGDEAYQAARYGEAMQAYGGARSLIPDAPVTAELHSAATERYAQAAVEHGRELARNGDVAAAKAAVDQVLAPGVAPDNPGALRLRNELDDPIRTNPALDAEHARNVDEVRRLLYTAEGAFNLGKFDEALTHYQSVLRIDPTNSAARRGMERVAAAKSESSQAAYDQARAEMLSQVDAAWETAVPAPDLGPGFTDPGAITEPAGPVTISAKLERIIIPKIALDQASIEEALDFIRVAATQNDNTEADPARKGVNITLNLGPPESESARRIRGLKFDLRLSQVPLSRVLKYICDLTQTRFTTDEFSVIITQTDFSADELMTRSFRVPPDFISSLSTGVAAGGGAAADPFAEEAPAGGGLLTTRLSAQEVLANQGVAFPEGASASYNAATNTLRVVNTAANLDLIAQIVETVSLTEPVMIAVRVTMIRTQRSNLQELGFDWLVNPFALDSGDNVYGAGGTIGNTPGRTAADFNPIMPGVPGDPTALVTNGVVTNGLRSGDTATPATSIDGLLNNIDRATQRDSVAPGVLSLTGLFTDGQVQMIMRGLDQKSGIDLMSQPATITRSGQAANITLVREFMYPTEYDPPEIPTSVGVSRGGGAAPVTPANPTSFDKRDVGITLDVLPVAAADKRFIDISVTPSLVEFDGFINFGSPITTSTTNLVGQPVSVELSKNAILMPIFSVQKAATQLTVADGSTITIGGLMSDTIQNVEDKVPVLGDIPLMGRLFRSTSRKPISTAIVFLVQAELLDPTGRPYRSR